eukprot:TRINITY_DN24018_c0_g1_i1.p1 TRINITY_DN24018_c0_g1~~TRINITY_DN24018_c0_g1_i1.p1  ORF type:complete len:579 (+),score=100.22 TRINITY_DN24018_c0_g1_i1:16-1752(+)
MSTMHTPEGDVKSLMHSELPPLGPATPGDTRNPPRHLFEFSRPENLEWLKDRYNYLKNSRSWRLLTGGIPAQDELMTQYKIDPLYGGEIIARHSAELPSPRTRYSRQLALAELSMSQWHSIPYETMLKFGFLAGGFTGFSIGVVKLIGNIGVAICGVATIPLYLAEKQHIPSPIESYKYYRLKAEIARHNMWHTFSRYVDKFIPKTKSAIAREKRRKETQSVNLYQYLKKRKDFDKYHTLPQKPIAPATHRVSDLADLLKKHANFRSWIYNHRLSELSRTYRQRYQMLPTDPIPAFGRFTILCTYLYPKFKFGATLVTRMVPFVWKHVKYSAKVGPYFFLSMKFHMTITAFVYYNLPWDIRKNIQTAHGFWYLFVFCLGYRNWLWFIGRLGPEPPKVTKSLVLPIFIGFLFCGMAWDNLTAGVHGYRVVPPPSILKDQTNKKQKQSWDPRMLADFLTALQQEWILAKHRILYPDRPKPVFPPIMISADPDDPANTHPDRPQLPAHEMLNHPTEWLALRSGDAPESPAPQHPFPQWHIATREPITYKKKHHENDIMPPDFTEEEVENYGLKNRRKKPEQ